MNTQQKTIEGRKLQLKLEDENQTKILTSLFYELDKQGFKLSVYDGELFNSVSSLKDILDLYHDLSEMHIYVQKDDYKACASFIFWNGEDGIFCMYDYTYSLIDFLPKTNDLIYTLADERCERRELERLIESREKEKLVIKETIAHLMKNGFAIKNKNGSKCDINELLDLHARIFEQNNKAEGEEGEEIIIRVLDSDHDDGFISFKPHSGYFKIISGFSNNLSAYMNYIGEFMMKIKYGQVIITPK